jgi:cytochrome b561
MLLLGHEQGIAVMAARSSTDRYGSIAITIHWLTAIAILALLGLGLAAANAADPATKAGLLRAHVPLGTLVLLLTIFRIVWWFIDRRPAALAGLPRWQISIEAIVRVLLYAFILLLGASGIAMIALSGAGAILFGGEARTLPDFWSYPPMRAHFFAVIALVVLAALHVAAAFYHQFLRRDRLLYRMGLGSTPPA